MIVCSSRTTQRLKGHGSRDPRSEEKSKYIDDDGNVIKMPGADYADRGDRNGYKWCYHVLPPVLHVLAISTISTTLKDIDMQLFKNFAVNHPELILQSLFSTASRSAGEDNGVRVLYDGMKWREAFLAWRWHLGKEAKATQRVPSQ